MSIKKITSTLNRISTIESPFELTSRNIKDLVKEILSNSNWILKWLKSNTSYIPWIIEKVNEDNEKWYKTSHLLSDIKIYLELKEIPSKSISRLLKWFHSKGIIMEK